MTVNIRSLIGVSVVPLVVGVALFFKARGIQSGFGYDAVGPAVFPMIIAGGFVISALLIFLENYRSSGDDSSEVAEVTRFWPVIVISAAILAEALLIERAGWVPMATVVFAAGAWAFGDRRLVLSAVIGLILACLIIYAFNWGLGLDLPLGAIAPLFPADQ